jgi:hypothetical protein
VIDIAVLGRRAVACKGWRWMPGQRWIVTRAAPLEDYAGRIAEYGQRAPDGPGLPDLRDCATLGCLLALVREAHGDPVLFARFRGARVHADWVVSWDGSDLIATGATEAEALVAALESAP